ELISPWPVVFEGRREPARQARREHAEVARVHEIGLPRARIAGDAQRVTHVLGRDVRGADREARHAERRLDVVVREDVVAAERVRRSGAWHEDGRVVTAPRERPRRVQEDLGVGLRRGQQVLVREENAHLSSYEGTPSGYLAPSERRLRGGGRNSL